MTNTTRTARTARTAAAAPVTPEVPVAAAAPVTPEVTPAATLAGDEPITLADGEAARPAFGTDGWVAIIDQAALAAYRTGDRSGMAQVRSMITKRQASAFAAGDVSGAFDAAATLAALAPAASVAAVTPAFVTVAAQVAAYRAAADALADGSVVPDGIDASGIDYTALAATLAALTVSPLTEEASERFAAAAAAGATLAAARITRAVGTNNVCDIIAAAFAGRPVGTFLTVAQIRVAGASAATAGHITRDGAIAARLFPAEGAAIPSLPAGVRAVRSSAQVPVRGAELIAVEVAPVAPVAVPPTAL